MKTDRIIQVKKNKISSIERRHPWIFSGAFFDLPNDLHEGALVEVQDYQANFLALGFYHRGSIAVKVISFKNFDTIEELIEARVKNAIDYRRSVGFMDQEDTNCFRLFFGEGDMLPGLISDVYDSTLVLQSHTIAWQKHLHIIAKMVVKLLPTIERVYHRPSSKLKEVKAEYLLGDALASSTIIENGVQFKVNWEEGQKTGFFIDQRESRKLLGQYAKGKKVLNTFSYSGGFSMYALLNGAVESTDIDLSASAIELANENATLNSVKNHNSEVSDVLEYLKEKALDYDIIVLDPPAFSKSRRTTHKAVQAYKRLNKVAIQRAKPNSLIFTFSCSQHITPKLFSDTIMAAAIEAGKNIRIIQKLGQPADHPINIFYPEGEYLKGLLLAVD